MRQTEGSPVSNSGSTAVAGAPLALLVVVLLGLTGCGDRRSVALGIAQELGMSDEPSAAAEMVDVLCDYSRSSTCNRESLAATLDTVATRAAGRPGSHLRLWLLGESVGSTVTVAEQVSPVSNARSDSAKQRAADRWAKDAVGYLFLAAQPAWNVEPPSRSPIASAIAKILLASSAGLSRRLVVIGDAKEMELFDGECGSLPTDASWTARLKKRRLLEPGSATGVAVNFDHMSGTPIGRCPVAVGRELRLRALWRQGLLAAGARCVTFDSGVVDLHEEPAAVTAAVTP